MECSPPCKHGKKKKKKSDDDQAMHHLDTTNAFINVNNSIIEVSSLALPLLLALLEAEAACPAGEQLQRGRSCCLAGLRGCSCWAAHKGKGPGPGAAEGCALPVLEANGAGACSPGGCCGCAAMGPSLAWGGGPARGTH